MCFLSATVPARTACLVPLAPSCPLFPLSVLCFFSLRDLNGCSQFTRATLFSGPSFFLPFRTELGPPKSLEGFKNFSRRRPRSGATKSHHILPLWELLHLARLREGSRKSLLSGMQKKLPQRPQKALILMPGGVPKLKKCPQDAYLKKPSNSNAKRSHFDPPRSCRKSLQI